MAAEITKESKKRLKEFEKALKMMSAGKHSEARQTLNELIGKADEDPHLSAGAKKYLRICERKLTEVSPPEKGNPEEHYDQGVYCHNAGRYKEAMELFQQALKVSDGDSGYIYYAMAATEARQQNADKAVEFLAKSVEQSRENAFHASGDPDFRSLSSNKQFQELLESVTKE